MKRVLLILSLAIGCCLLASCEKETMLAVNLTSLSFNNDGGSQTVNLVANKVWSASSNQSWCKVSPFSGDGSDNSNFTLSVSCDANATYDERTCTITITCEELTKTISVSQTEGKGLIISQTEYNLTNDAQTISVEVQANVNYSVEIDNACKSWIKQEATKGLSSNIIKFAISKNEDYDGREGKIVIKQTEGSLSGTVVVKQSQQNGLFVSPSDFSISCDSQSLTVEVKANVEFDVKSNVDWVRYVETKGLKTSQIVLEVFENYTHTDRKGTVVVKQKNGDLEGVITIRQEAEGFVEFEDANFKAYCLSNFDIDKDGEISMTEARMIEYISVLTEDITSMKGIEHMPNLIKLYCIGFEYDGQLKSLDVSNNTSLTLLWCEKNQLTSLDVSNNVLLTDLRCAKNKLTSLDVSNNTALSYLSCSDNQLTSLNVSKNTQLSFLSCARNQLTSLDVSNIATLEQLSCSVNKLTSLDISDNASLSNLRCDDNLLTGLDVSKNTALKWLYCSNNQLTNLNVNSNTALTDLRCGSNQLTSLDVSRLSLTYLSCEKNQLTNLVVSNHTELSYLYCNDNQLTSLDVSKNNGLLLLTCEGNQLTSLDISNNPKLENLSCGYNQLTSLDISNNPKLEYLSCRYNQLTSLDVSNSRYLQNLYCDSNKLSVLRVDSNTSLNVLSCSGNLLSSLDVSKNYSLEKLACTTNYLTTLDVSNNTKLSILYCQYNPYLTEIWLKTGQTISDFQYDKDVATIKYN